MNRYSLWFLLASLPLNCWDVKEWVPEIFSSSEMVNSSAHIHLSQPCTLVIDHSLRGLVNVKGWNKPYAAFTIEKEGSPEHLDQTTVTINKNKLPKELTCTVAHEGNGKHAAHVNLFVNVPHNTVVKIATKKASVKTKRLNASQQVITHGGSITIKLPTHTDNQAVFAQSEKGKITVKVSKKCNAHLLASTRKGSVTSDVMVTLDPQTTLINKEFWHRMRHEARGCIGAGGIPLTLESTSGDIAILAF